MPRNPITEPEAAGGAQLDLAVLDRLAGFGVDDLTTNRYQSEAVDPELKPPKVHAFRNAKRHSQGKVRGVWIVNDLRKTNSVLGCRIDADPVAAHRVVQPGTKLVLTGSRSCDSEMSV